jgi:hypothetical protein
MPECQRKVSPAPASSPVVNRVSLASAFQHQVSPILLVTDYHCIAQLYPDLIPDYYLKPDLHPIYHLLALLCQMPVAVELPIFIYVQSALTDGILIQMLPAEIARWIQPMSSSSQIS